MVDDIKWDDESTQAGGDNVAWEPEISGLESFGRGAANALALGYSPQLIAAAKTANFPGSNDPAYLAELARQKEANNAAWNTHPYYYGSGMVASAIPSAVGAVMAAPEAGAAVGAGELLANTGNIANIASTGLRGLAGGSQLAGKAASILENPLTQGAIYGSSEGDTIGDKLSGAAAGAIGAKVAPMLLGAAGKAIGAAGSKIAPYITDPIANILTGAPNKAAQAGAIADQLGISFPSAAIEQSVIGKTASKADPLKSIPTAAANHLQELGGKFKSFAGDANPADAGSSIQDAVQKWATASPEELPTGFKAQMNSYFAPLGEINQNGTFGINNLRSAVIQAAKSPAGTVGDIKPTLSVIAPVWDRANDLSFPEMRQLRDNISRQIKWGQLPGNQPTDAGILKSLRAALTKDMQSAANQYGGNDLLSAFNEADAKASNLYKLQDSVFDIAKPNTQPGTVYQKIINGLSPIGKGPDRSSIANLKTVTDSVDPSIWGDLQSAYINHKIAPQGQFSYKNFNTNYNQNLHPEGKNILFGNQTQNGNSIRDVLEKINQLGQLTADGTQLGGKIDSFASQAGAKANVAGLGEGALALAEMGLYGVPVKALTAAGLGSVAGKMGARNIAAPLSPYQAGPIGQFGSNLIQQATPALTAQAINPLGGGAVKAAVPWMLNKAMNQVPGWNPPGSQRAYGGRTGHAAGGKVGFDHEAKADKLILLADKIKKDEAKKTSSILNVDDSTVARALAVVNRKI